MQALTGGEILKATQGTLIAGNENAVFTKIDTDSRKISTGELFVPIIGERFDGHDFILDSLSSGASGALTQKEFQAVEGKTIIRVKDTQKALGDIARYYRQKFNIPFTAITGSVGKTSTKDMVACVLSHKYNVLKTEGNFNNEIGLPLTILNLEHSHEAGVIEMGMSGFGEISRLTSIVRPHIAVITNIGLSHIEKLGSRQNILKAKLEILEGLDKDGLVILNGDDAMLSGLKGLIGFRTVFYGIEDGAFYKAFNILSEGEKGTRFEVTVSGRDYRVFVPVPGIHNVYNALAAIAAGVELNVPMEDIILGISEFCSGRMRMNIIGHKGIKIINDAYNASPQSMKAALDVLRDIGSQSRTVAILGDMLEMGEWAADAHLDVGCYAAEKGIHYIITVGKNAKYIAKGALDTGARTNCVYAFPDPGEAWDFLKNFLCEGDVVLVKGSRGMRMEEIVNRITGI